MPTTSRAFLRRRGAAVALAATVLLAPFAQSAAAAESAAAPSSSVAAPSTDPATTVATIEARTARAVARSLADPAWQDRVEKAALASETVRLAPLADRADDEAAARTLAPRLHRAERRLAEAKGLDADTPPLLNLRLAADSMRAALADGRAPLVAAAPADETARTVPAYDSRGRTHTLNVRSVPERPVYIVDVDATRALAAGMDVLREELTAQGLGGAAARVADNAPTAQGGFWTTRITSVRLSDNKEPWVKGSSEIYTLVTGFGHDGKVRVDPVEMPYLDDEDHTYYPNQVLVNWSYYKYNLADAVMMEEDGGTNYHDLAQALATALLTITDQGMYIPLVNALLDAIPTDWWTDDPDYVDSWYTLAQGDRGTLNGAAGNGTMGVEPYFVDAL
ncbi:DUF3103 family protein [Streptomyces sp. TR06-5]|uniref:DUF3103 family protein n=1 Tax=Streptomyces sp. TR06-5 TaxID=3385976 RepID=UPI0039A3600C